MLPIPRKLNRRAAFSLIEILVVMIVILVLIGLSAYAILSFRNTGPAVATLSTMGKVKAAIDSQWQAIRDKAQREEYPPSVNRSTLTTSAGATSIADPRVRSKYVELRLLQAFPTKTADVVSGSHVAAIGKWDPYVKHIVASGTINPEAEQAFCIMMALQKGPSNQGLTPDILGTSATIRTGNDWGVADAWGNPLRFSMDATGSTPFVLWSKGGNGKFDTQFPLTSDKEPLVDDIRHPDRTP